MNFNHWIELMQQKLSNPLPGWAVQKLASPSNRLGQRHSYRVLENHRLSAVLALFFPTENGPQLALMKRSDYEGVHSGQISLPGGKMEATDEGLTHTALRETEEELGVPFADVQVLGSLTQVYIPPSNFLVHPYVGAVQQMPVFTPNEEVAEIVQISIDELIDPLNFKVKLRQLSQYPEPIQIPYFDLQGHHVWGATAMMLKELKAVINSLDKP